MKSSFTTTNRANTLDSYILLTDAERANADPPSVATRNQAMISKYASKTKTVRIEETKDTYLSPSQRELCKSFLDAARDSLVPNSSDLKIVLGTNISGDNNKEIFNQLLDLSTDNIYNSLKSLHPGERGSKIAFRRTEAAEGCIGFHTDGGYATFTAQLTLNSDDE
ncbi:hypothetical protein TrLO_g1694 [Triparma laevis f. longispina]|uniref:Uncharacterized protein n=1 Tax=Triparma laevis f. longispina TaxID=1714387 RepID=A0A9W7FRQ5_9STRA|nr:hypothetical protein TrLO_g1694 [Triparma laevis f. longispina]